MEGCGFRPSSALSRVPRGEPEEKSADTQDDEEQSQEDDHEVITTFNNSGPVAAATQLEEFPEAVHAGQSSPGIRPRNRKNLGRRRLTVRMISERTTPG